MKQYIDKDALVAEIEKRKKTNKECMLGLRNLDYYQGKVDALNDTLSLISTLKVKEVDLKKEINNWIKDNTCRGYCSASISETAEYFFELGLKAQKGE